MDCCTRSRSAFSCPLDFAAGSRYIDTSGSNPKPFAQTINSRNSSPESADSLEIMRTIKFPLPISSYVLSTALHPPSVCTRISGSLVSIFVFYLVCLPQGLGLRCRASGVSDLAMRFPLLQCCSLQPLPALPVHVLSFDVKSGIPAPLISCDAPPLLHAIFPRRAKIMQMGVCVE